MPRKAFAVNTVNWEQLAARLKERAVEFPHLQEACAELAAATEDAKRLRKRYLDLNAEALHASQRLQETVERAARLESRLRSLVKGALGPDSSELFEFGIQPRKGRRDKDSPETAS